MHKNNSWKKNVTLDDLALMVAKGFDAMNEKMDNGFKGVTLDIKKLETDVAILKIDVEEIKTDVKDTKANLNKKVDKIEHNTLDYRVEKLEKKFA